MEPRVYDYESGLRWTEEHRGVSYSEGKPDIEIACPPEFGGHQGYWTPEHLFVCSVEVCVMTTFLSLFEKTVGVLVSYESEAIGKAGMQDWVFRFTSLTIRPRIVVEGQGSIALAREAIDQAAEQCLISKVLKFRPVVDPVIECAV
jgi:organic hydroperoxide reductase OsmC/OhrA